MKKNVVRILALVLVGLMVLSLLPLVTYASDWCPHTQFTTVTVEPVCGEDGYTAAVCLTCGQEFGMEIIPHTEEHDYSACVVSDDYLITLGDCLEPSLYYKSCSKCGHIAEFAYQQAMEQMQQSLWDQYNREVAYYGAPVSDWEARIRQATEDIQNLYTFKVGGDGHHFYEVEGQEATCTSDGWLPYRVCEVCGEVEGYQTVPAKGHRFGEWVVTKEPTCTEDGLKERVCEVCGETETEPVPATGHQGKFTTIKAPTCTEPGSEKRICTVCQTEEIREIPATGHKGPFTVTREATCTEPGVQERDCEVCGAHETAPVPAAHKYGPDGRCVFCGEENPEAAIVADNETFGEAETDGQTPDAETNDNAAPEENGTDLAAVENAVEEDNETFDASKFQDVKIIRKDGQEFEYDGVVLVGTTLKISAEVPSGYTAYWIPKNGNSTDEQNVTMIPGPEYTVDSYIDGTVVCVIIDNNSQKEAGRSNTLRIRKEITIEATTRGEGEFRYSYERLGGGDEGLVDWSSKVFLTGDKLTFSVTPDVAQRYIFRRIATVTKSGSGETIRAQTTAHDADTNTDSYTFTVSTSSATSYLLETDRPSLYNEIKPTLGDDSDIYISKAAENKLEELRKELVGAYNVSDDSVMAGVIRYVTPIWASDALAMSKTSIENATAFNLIEPFMLAYPAGIDYTKALIQPYHYNTTTGLWEQISAAAYTLLADGAQIKGYTDFSPFAVIGVQQVKITLVANNGTDETDSATVFKGSDYVVPSCGFTPEKDKAFKNWLGSDGETYEVGATIPKTKLTADFTLTAQWIEGHTITFNKNDEKASGSMEKLFVPGGKEVTLTKNAFTLKNHEFIGWSTTADGEKQYDDEQKVTPEADLDLYAKWRRTASTIYFDPNGGSGAMSEQTAALGGKITLPKNTFQNGEKLFSGWSTEKGGDIVYADGETISVPAKDQTLYAVWDYKVAVHYSPESDNGTGTGTMADQIVPGGRKFTLTKNSFKAPDLSVFDGWNTVRDGSGTPYTDGQEIAEGFTEDVTLYAQWKRTAYTVTYLGNGGIGTMSTQTIPVNGAVAVSENKFTAPYGREFVGWSETEGEFNEADERFAPGKPLKANELKRDLTLYAVWKDIVTLHFDKNNSGATGTMADQKITKDKETALNANSFKVPTGWTFKYWTAGTTVDPFPTRSASEVNTPDVENKVYKDKDKITVSADTTLYAQWERVSYSISYNANGGTGTTASQTVPKDGGVALSASKFTAPVGKIFAGWSKTSGQGNTADYQPGDAVNWEDLNKEHEDLTLYAVWKDKVTVHFDHDSDSGSGSGTMADQEAPKGEKFTLDANKFTAPSGMAFGGWNTQKDGKGTAFTDGQEITEGFTEDTTLYAQWLEDACTITFDKNDTEPPCETKNQSALKGVATKLEANTFEAPAGMAFTSWNTKRDGSGTAFKDQATVKVSKDITLYAQWMKAATITFDKNAADATGTMSPQVVETGVGTALEANSFKRVNYQFEGWTTNPDGSGEKYADMGVITAMKDTTLYAVWKQIAYAITYDPNGGGGDQMAQQNVPIGNTATIRDCAYNPKPGEVFAYWQEIKLFDASYAPEGGGEHSDIYYPGEKIVPTRDLALKAVWVDELVISYYPGEGSGTYNEGEVPKGVPTYVKTASEAKFTAPANSTFAYWQDENGNRYYENQQYVFNENTKLTAIWAPACTIVYNKNASDAKGTMANQTAPSGVEVTLSDNKFTRSEYIFKYWTKTKSDPYPNKRPEEVTSSDVYKDGTGITVTQDTNLYAQWYKTAITAGAVAITGEVTGLDDFAVWGETLTAVVNDPVLKSGFTYTWQVDGNPVKSGDDNTYEVKKEDYGKTIVCVVSHPQATNEVESNPKIVGTYAESDDLMIINNGNENYPYSKYAYVFGVVPGTTFYKDGKAYLVPESAEDGIMEIGLPGTYTFGHATYYIQNWYTVGYEVDASGGGTVTMKNGTVTLTSTTKTSDIQHFTGTVWLVRDGSATDINITMKPASSTYVHWALNGGNYSSSSTEVSRRLGTINQPMLFSIVFNKSSSSPKTGDMSHLGMWSALCFTSLVGAAAMLSETRKRRKSK